MKRLKQLREGANYSQQQLASMLKTTQQTIGRWESGKAEPNLSALRDLALIFGTSVDDLLGVNPMRGKVSSTTYHLFTQGAQDGCWGHIGLKFDATPSQWFPVTAGTIDRVRGELVNIEDQQAWISFETLANKFVAFRPTAVRKIWLLDDACDQPEGDWELDLPYQGLPLEMYRAFEQLHDLPISPEAWETAATKIPKTDHDGKLESGDPTAWESFVKEVHQNFDEEASEPFLGAVAERFAEERLYDQDHFYRYMHYTAVHFVDGDTEAFWVEAGDLNDFVFELDMESVPAIVRLEHFGGSAEPYYSSSRMTAVVMPLLDLMDARKESNDADDEALESLQSE